MTDVVDDAAAREAEAVALGFASADEHEAAVAEFAERMTEARENGTPALPIELDPANIAQNADETWRALKGVQDPDHPDVLLRGGILSRLVHTTDNRVKIEPFTQTSMRDLMSRRIQFWSGGEKPKIVKPPVDVAQTLVSRRPEDLPGAPVIERVVDVPVFGFDETGTETLLTTTGYHPHSRTYYVPPQGLSLAPPPDWGGLGYDEDYHADQYMKAEEVHDALVFIRDELLGDFAFADKASLAHAICLILEPFVRELIGNHPTPLYVLMASQHGVGKTLLARTCLSVGCGHVTASPPPSLNEDETRKRITADLMGGPSAIWFDNIGRPLDSATLASALTTPHWSDRILGGSRMLDVTIRNVWVATMNNPTLSTELARRSVPIFLDAGVQDPWTRTGRAPGSSWKHPLPQWADENRDRLIDCALILVYNWIHGARLAVNDEGDIYRTRVVNRTSFLGSYARWSEVMGGIMQALGSRHFLGNLDKLHDEVDVDRDDNAVFLAEWHAHSEEPKTISEVDEMLGLPRNIGVLPMDWSLPVQLRGRREDRAKKLQTWLRSNKGAINNGYALRVVGKQPRRWYVEKVT